MARGFLATAILLIFIVSQVQDVTGNCSVNADCNCIDNLCQDVDGIIYADAACTISDLCYCDTTTGEGNLCLYSRSPPPKDPSLSPTNSPTKAPSVEIPTNSPTDQPTDQPTKTPTDGPSTKPVTDNPTRGPTSKPVTNSPTDQPNDQPTKSPTNGPSTKPVTDSPTRGPSTKPVTNSPTDQPTSQPTTSPTNGPSTKPVTDSPTRGPTLKPATASPSKSPSENPIMSPTGQPSKAPSSAPIITSSPTSTPSKAPTTPNPTSSPSANPTTKRPTNAPTTNNPTAPPPPVTDQPTTSKPTTAKPTVNPTVSMIPSCEDPEEGCGWGIWNVWTCQCDCAPGFCLSANQQCYDGCTTRTDFNPWGGCIPGTDCPWYPDSSGKTHCISTVNFAGQYNIHRTSEQCCEKHFRYINISTCIEGSEQSVEDAKDIITENEQRQNYFYPDLFGRDNCIYHNGYYEWMMGSYSDLYLFSSDLDCCSMWYPARTDCPDLSQPTERDVDERPYPVKGYFYPHMSESNCRFGRNYPMWMAQEGYVQHHLFTTPEECCVKWYPGSGESCPLGPDDGVQEGRYWQTDVFYYPNWKGRWCNVGNDYPEWMADPTKIDTHLFESGSACCEAWFSDEVVDCEMNVTATHNGKPINGEEEDEEWYPTMVYPYKCVDDGNIPSWMLQTGYRQHYVFDSKAECCSAHYCTSTSSLFWRRNG